MKNFFLSLLIIFPLASFEQTIVSTTPSNKNVVLEEFTGINCGWCPEGHAVANQIATNNPGRVVIINVHAGSFATPSAGQPDFRTSFGTSLLNQTGITGFPAGTVNRHVFPGYEMTAGKTGMGRDKWANASSTILEQSSCLNIGATAEIDVISRTLTVYVEVYYTGNSATATNKLNVALLQNNTVGYQAGGSSTYNHMHRLVHLLSEQWGADISTTSQGSLHSQTFTYLLPADFNTIPANIEDMEIAVFVAEGTQEIISGILVEPEFVNVPATEFFIAENSFPTELNFGKFTPVIEVKSYGSALLSSMNITYQINDEPIVNYEWVGELNFSEKVTITLPETPEFILYPQNTITATIVTEDGTPENNTITVNFSKAPVTTINDLTVEVKTDAYGSETTWNIKNELNETVANGGPYSDGGATIRTKEVNLPTGNYMITVNDSYGDGILGSGYVKIKTETETILNIAGNSFTSSTYRLFKVTVPALLTFSPENGSAGNTMEEPFTIVSDKRLFASDWILLNNDNIASHVILKLGDENGADLNFTATIDELGKNVTVVTSESISNGQSLYLALVSTIHDEDGLVPDVTSSTFTIGTTGINEVVTGMISVYPNPSEGIFTVELNENERNSQIQLFSSTGSLIHKMNTVSAINDFSLELSSGIYFVKVISGNGPVSVQKLVVK